MKDIEIKLASANDAIKIEPIFSLYREFYGMEKDSPGTIDFLRKRLGSNESILLYAERNGSIIGFTQLYPTFSSASLRKAFVLNDLYVIETERKQGIAKLLINESIEIAKRDECVRISLSTAKDNPAQILYEKMGFKESSFKFYNYNI
ncbi:GNAT family N-acetyltransferase [Sphingobacterium sp. DN00404]|uniref:GNAT family N-acetyltransferase n=1 Tax=Sphingobacterium micropteri TaxID=2763501 RepID=A0ABR7YJY1_9SPHI|nr:GNAT family N-acetyltransferase [Sphingobacterium micropteri]MBD1431571.1 GNAT family N-acetyltransferase [Sphingobacterium micropteri]